MRRIFGEQIYVPLEAGVQRMADWVKKTGLRRSRTLPQIEAWQHLPPSWKQVLKEAGQTPDQLDFERGGGYSKAQ